MERSSPRQRPGDAPSPVGAHVSGTAPEPGDQATRRRPHLALVEPRLLIRESLSTLLAAYGGGGAASGFRIASFATVGELREATKRSDFDLVVVNIGLSSLRDAEVREELALLRQASPETDVVVFSDQENPADARAALLQGLKGYIPTRLPPHVVLQALNLVLAGGTYAPTEAFLRRTDSIAAGECNGAPPPHNFTRREWQVMERLRRGESNKAIAYALNLHASTVKVYVRQIMRKLSATNRTHAAFLISQALQVEN